jgi:hypothetical protein
VSETPIRPSLVVLFAARRELDLSALGAALASFSPLLAEATIEMTVGAPVASVRFGQHEVRVRAVDEPLPEALAEPCIQLAHYDEQAKDEARRHGCFVVCEHAPGPLFVVAEARAVALVAAAVARLGGVAIANLAAKTSVPAAMFAEVTGDMVEFVEALPLLILSLGFAKYTVAGREGVWMRTHGGAAMGLPDLARLAPSHLEGQRTFALFNATLVYLVESRAAMAPGDVAQLADGSIVRFRAPSPIESFLEGEGTILVVEELGPGEVVAPRGAEG